MTYEKKKNLFMYKIPRDTLSGTPLGGKTNKQKQSENKIEELIQVHIFGKVHFIQTLI